MPTPKIARPFDRHVECGDLLRDVERMPRWEDDDAGRERIVVRLED
jgi:hypothetical protein